MHKSHRRAPRPSGELTRLASEREWNSPWRDEEDGFYDDRYGIRSISKHQTGWTALTAILAQILGTVDDKAVLSPDNKTRVAQYGFVHGVYGPETGAK